MSWALKTETWTREAMRNTDEKGQGAAGAVPEGSRGGEHLAPPEQTVAVATAREVARAEQAECRPPGQQPCGVYAGHMTRPELGRNSISTIKTKALKIMLAQRITLQQVEHFLNCTVLGIRCHALESMAQEVSHAPLSAYNRTNPCSPATFVSEELLPLSRVQSIWPTL